MTCKVSKIFSIFIIQLNALGIGGKIQVNIFPSILRIYPNGINANLILNIQIDSVQGNSLQVKTENWFMDFSGPGQTGL